MSWPSSYKFRVLHIMLDAGKDSQIFSYGTRQEAEDHYMQVVMQQPQDRVVRLSSYVIDEETKTCLDMEVLRYYDPRPPEKKGHWW